MLPAFFYPGLNAWSPCHCCLVRFAGQIQATTTRDIKIQPATAKYTQLQPAMCTDNLRQPAMTKYSQLHADTQLEP